jgi:hypothetical protein
MKSAQPSLGRNNAFHYRDPDDYIDVDLMIEDIDPELDANAEATADSGMSAGM